MLVRIEEGGETAIIDLDKVVCIKKVGDHALIHLGDTIVLTVENTTVKQVLNQINNQIRGHI